MYIQALEDAEFHNPDFRSEKLKNKLENRFGDEVAFCRLEAKGKYVSQLIYSANTKMETAVQSAFVLGSKDIMVEAALYLNKRPKGPHIVHLSTMYHLFGELARAAIMFFRSARKTQTW